LLGRQCLKVTCDPTGSDHPEQAAALIERGKTLAEWLVEQDKSVAVEPRKAKQRIVDALGMLALLSLAVLVGFGWITLRVLKSL
jgi:hypothetical protein